MPNGGQVTNITVATSDTWRDKDTGEQKEVVEWHKIIFFGKLAEIAGQYLKKGGQVFIEGRIQTRKWQDKDGQDRYTTEIVANEMQMLRSNSDQISEPSQNAGYGGYGTNSPAANQKQTSTSDYAARKNAPPPPAAAFHDDDIPF